MENYPGKFIVIDGTDGSGKATQTQLLAERLSRAGFDVAMADFPQYEKKSAGLIEKYLAGKYGTAKQVGPYRASIFYAADRYDASFKIKRWLSEGKTVVANRYVTANLAHQGGKISNPLERKHFFDWLIELEYEIFEIPKPDLNIILHLPADISRALIKSRQFRLGQPLDIHEDDLEHLKQAENVYLEIAKIFPDTILIECARDGKILDKEAINNLLWHEVKKILSVRPPAAEISLSAADYYSILPGHSSLVKTNQKLKIPPGQTGVVIDQLGLKQSGLHAMPNVLNSSKGEISIFLINLGQDIFHLAPGQKIARLRIIG